MANWKYYPQNVYVEQATLTALTGTSSTLGLCQNYRARSRCDIDTVSNYTFAFKITTQGTTAITPNFCAFVNSNFQGGGLYVYCGESVDNGTTWDHYAVDDYGLATGISPVLVCTNWIGTKSKIHWRVLLTATETSAYFGNFFMGAARTPSVDCNYGQPLIYDRTGVKISETDGGNVFSIKRYGLKRIWTIQYEAINDADMAILTGLESDCDGPHRPFIFTDSDGALYYGRMNSQMQATPTTAGLWDVTFQIREEITT